MIHIARRTRLRYAHCRIYRSKKISQKINLLIKYISSEALPTNDVLSVQPSNIPQSTTSLTEV